MEASTAGDEVDEADVHVHLQDPALEDKFLAAVEIVTSLPVEAVLLKQLIGHIQSSFCTIGKIVRSQGDGPISNTGFVLDLIRTSSFIVRGFYRRT
ncbi:unnamed protein product [Nippostrongylus brasiliensis]|uniref:Exocyst complex component Sec8 n=1 Tax=Nippostrongylus brasiliensis TaxID=27835 RepID=A0A0N4YZ04_NIPBR|nr:unnamed protein product [Nippostrongylus brasiliensis]